MSIRTTRKNQRSRARTAEDKVLVREAFIMAGRELFSTNDPRKVSLRQIAAAAGYAPGAIYQYFADQRELFAYIREHDMQAAFQAMAAAITRTKDPKRRVLRLFDATVDYWLDHMDHFLVLFPAPTRLPAVVTPGTVPFGRSPVVRNILKLYYDTVQAMFDELPRAPMPSRVAADMLLAAVYGSIVFPRMTATMPWSDTRRMTRALVRSVVADWVRSAR